MRQIKGVWTPNQLRYYKVGGHCSLDVPYAGLPLYQCYVKVLLCLLLASHRTGSQTCWSRGTNRIWLIWINIYLWRKKIIFLPTLRIYVILKNDTFGGIFYFPNSGVVDFLSSDLVVGGLCGLEAVETRGNTFSLLFGVSWCAASDQFNPSFPRSALVSTFKLYTFLNVLVFFISCRTLMRQTETHSAVWSLCFIVLAHFNSLVISRDSESVLETT